MKIGMNELLQLRPSGAEAREHTDHPSSLYSVHPVAKSVYSIVQNCENIYCLSRWRALFSFVKTLFGQQHFYFYKMRQSRICLYLTS